MSGLICYLLFDVTVVQQACKVLKSFLNKLFVAICHFEYDSSTFCFEEKVKNFVKCARQLQNVQSGKKARKGRKGKSSFFHDGLSILISIKVWEMDKIAFALNLKDFNWYNLNYNTLKSFMLGSFFEQKKENIFDSSMS